MALKKEAGISNGLLKSIWGEKNGIATEIKLLTESARHKELEFLLCWMSDVKELVAAKSF